MVGGGYDRALRAYAARHGRPPQTATMHPATATALGVRDGLPRSGAQERPLVVTSPEYEAHTITLYY